MIVLNVTYICKPGMREAFLESVAEEAIDLTSRTEPGNYKYDYYRSADKQDELLLIEKWEDENSLAVHRCQPHFLRLGELKAQYVKDTVIEQYEA